MVKLLVDDMAQVTMLELFLRNAHIPFGMEMWTDTCPIPPPTLIVDGVPFDQLHGMEWVMDVIENAQKLK